MRIYLAGPMTGIPKYNFPLFHQVGQHLTDEGHVVYSPLAYWQQMLGPDALHILNSMNPPELADGVRRAFAHQLSWLCRNAEQVQLLPGWHQSPGARAERLVALALDIPVEEVLDSILQTFVTRDAEDHEHTNANADNATRS